MRLTFSCIQCQLTGPTMVGLREKFSNKGSQKAGKRCFESGFCKCSISRVTIYLASKQNFTECVLDILLNPESTLRPTMVELGEKFFAIKVLRRLENDIFRLVLQIQGTRPLTVRSFTCRISILQSSTLANLPDFDDEMT